MFLVLVTAFTNAFLLVGGGHVVYTCPVTVAYNSDHILQEWENNTMYSITKHRGF